MELSKEKLDEIKAAGVQYLKDYYHLETYPEYDSFAMSAGKLGYERGATAYALKSLSIEKERDELKAEREEWVKLTGNAGEMPDTNCWVITEIGEICLVKEGEFVPLNAYTHYMVIKKPSPPLNK